MRMDERGIGWLVWILVAILGIFGIGFLSTINWKAILALFAAGIIAVAMIGVFVFKKDFKTAMIASIIALGLVFIVEVKFPVLVGGLMVLGVIYKGNLFRKNLTLFAILIGIGLLAMLIGYKLIVAPFGWFP